MTPLKIKFTDFWQTFDPRDNYFTRLLSSRYKLVQSDDPDLLVYSCFGMDFMRYRCVRLFYTGENIAPDYRRCDFSLTFDHDGRDGRNFRLPVFLMENDISRLTVPKEPDAALKGKSGFCNFIYTNPRPQERIRFFNLLSRYKRVDSGGLVLNNMGGPVADKPAFISRYKFTIAFESASAPGYTTEKLVEPMLAGSIPIYWGDPLAGRDFNTGSFINVHDFSGYEAVIGRIQELDSDDEAYRHLFSQPWLNGNRVPEPLQPAQVLAFMERVIAATRTAIPVAVSTRPSFFDTLACLIYRLKKRLMNCRWLVVLKQRLTGARTHPLLRGR